MRSATWSSPLASEAVSLSRHPTLKSPHPILWSNLRLHVKISVETFFAQFTQQHWAGLPRSKVSLTRLSSLDRLSPSTFIRSCQASVNGWCAHPGHSAARFVGVLACGARSLATRTLAKSSSHSYFSSAQRYSMTMFLPSTYPSSRSPCRNASMRAVLTEGESAPRYPIRGTFFDCCANDASGAERTRTQRNDQFAAIIHSSPLVGAHYARLRQGQQNDEFLTGGSYDRV